MGTVEKLAEAALHRDAMLVRGLAQRLMRSTQCFTDIPRPDLDDPQLMSIAAAIVELLAARTGQEPPAWTAEVGPMPEPFHLLFDPSEGMRWTRHLCETEAPEPLMKRRLYAPPDYLTFA